MLLVCVIVASYTYTDRYLCVLLVSFSRFYVDSYHRFNNEKLTSLCIFPWPWFLLALCSVSWLDRAFIILFGE